MALWITSRVPDYHKYMTTCDQIDTCRFFKEAMVKMPTIAEMMHTHSKTTRYTRWEYLPLILDNRIGTTR
jgi:hypothetical protein